MMASEGRKAIHGWWDVVLNLRRDEKMILCSWKEVHKCSQELNQACDIIFRSLWISHVLGLSLTQVLTHRVHPSDWVTALDNSFAVSFVDGQQVLEYATMEAYSRFLGYLQSNPAVTSEIILWVGNEGLDTPELFSDLMTVVYGGCLFQEDHAKFLELIVYLLSNHIDQCSTYKDLFVFEHEFSRAITEYCRHLPGLKEFLVCTLQDSLTKLVTYNKRFMEYDISKASTRLQQGEFDLVSFVEMSCTDLADFCMGVLKSLDMHKEKFPASLRWIFGSLKCMMEKKWPHITAMEIGRPISDVFFRYIISLAFTNPDLLGILDPSIVISEMSSYNISQVIGVLQGCAWIINRPSSSSEYPMRRVVKLMKTKRFVSLIEWLQVMPDTDHPPIKPVIPGLKKSFFMASKEQLENILIVTKEVNSSFQDVQGLNQAQKAISQAVALAPCSMIESVTRNPYSFSMKKFSSTDLLSTESPERGKKSKAKQRSRSMWGNKSDKINHASLKELSKTSTLTPVNSSKSNSSDMNFRQFTSLTDITIMSTMPREVFLIPLWRPDRNEHYSSSGLWEFELLSEEEFFRHKMGKPSPLQSVLSSKQFDVHDDMPDISLIQQQYSQHNFEQSQESFRDFPNGDNNSIKSWSPETYNGSVSAEEDEAEYKLVNDALSKSCEPSTATHLDIDIQQTMSSSYTEHREVRRKSFKAWLSHKIKKKQKSDHQSFESLTDKDVRRVGSYTKRVSHITEKYEKISKEKKMKEALETANKQEEQQLSSDSPHCLHIPSSVEEFKLLPLYLQMKFKLSVILSNVHVPTPPLPPPLTLTPKKGLVLLLEESLYRNQWIADSSESGVIKEVLSRINELDEECVRALYLGVVQDHLARQEYLCYLTNSRQKFTNMYLELGSVQQLIDRSRHLEETAFLNFSVTSFLESNREKLKELKSELEMCETADENCSVIQKYIEQFSHMLEMESMWNVWPEEDLSRVKECLVNHLFAHVYQQTFRPNGESDVQRDQVFFDLLKDLSLSVTPNHHLIKIQKVYLSTCPWPEVQRELLLMAAYQSPRGKLKCIIRACQLLIRSLQLSKCGDPPGADDTFPALVYIIIKSNPPNLLSTEQYIKTFCDSSLTGEDAYWWTQFQSAISFLRTPAFTSSFL